MGSQPTESNQVQSTSSQSKSEPHPYIQGDLLKQVEQLRAWQEKNPTAPGYYPGGTVVGRSPAAESARMSNWQMATGNLSNLDGVFDPSIRFLSDAASGKLVGQGDDIMARKLDAMFRPQNEQFVNLVAPSLQATFGSAGRPGGGLQWANIEDKFRNDLAVTQSDASAKAAADKYATDMGLRMSGATALPGVLGQKAGQAQGWLGLLDRVGAGDDDLNQRMLNDQNARYDYGNRAQLDFLTGMAQRYLGMFPGGQTLGSGTTQGWSTSGGGGGGAGQFIGPAVSIAGTALAMY
jgi:hypothetical protein